MSDPELFPVALGGDRIKQLAAAGIPKPEDPPAVEPAGGAKAELLYWQDGKYILRDSTGRQTSVEISERSEEHTSELQSHSFISYALFRLKKKIIFHVHEPSRHIRRIPS